MDRKKWKEINDRAQKHLTEFAKPVEPLKIELKPVPMIKLVPKKVEEHT